MSTHIKSASSTALSAASTFDLAPALAKGLHFMADAALKQGVHIMGGPGSGKSRFLGRVLVWQALARGLPTVVLDPTGAIMDNVADKMSRLPVAEGQQLAARLIYADVGAKDFIVPTPFYTRHSATESYEEIANRLTAVFVQADPNLQNAPIMGKNPLEECATYAGQIAAACGLQLEFVWELIKYPNRYADLLTYAVNQDPDLQKAANYFRELADSKNKALHERKTLAFLNKLHPFLSDKAVRATVNAVAPGLDWAAVVRNGQTVLIDFRHEWDSARRQFKLLWWLKDFTLFAKARGTASRGAEVMLVIDELTQLLGYRTAGGESILAGEIEELTTAHGRNFGINVVIAHQNLQQVDDRIQTALMQMGNQFIGYVAHPDDALLLARYFLSYDPHRVKKWETQWMALHEGTAWFLEPQGKNINGAPYQPLSLRTVPFPLDQKSTEFTPQEQYILLADQFRNLARFQFYLRQASAEGQIDHHLYPITLENLDPGEYPDVEALRVVRDWLRQQSGQPVDTVLAEMAAHTGQVLKAAKAERNKAGKSKAKALAAHATIGETAHDTTRHSISGITAVAGENRPGADPSQTTQAEDEDDIFS